MERKNYSFNLDVKGSKIYSDDLLKKTIYSNDSITFNISVKELDKAIDLTSTKIRLITTVGEGKATLEQTDDITITNPLEGQITIKLKGSNVAISDIYMGVLEIFNTQTQDVVHTQKFIYNVISSGCDEVVEEAKDDIETLSRLADVLEEYVTYIPVLDSEMDTLQLKIDNTMVSLEEQSKALQDKIDGINIDYEQNALRNFRLEPKEEIDGTISFLLPQVFTSVADKLCESSLHVNIGGVKVYNSDNRHTSNFALGFYCEKVGNFKLIKPIVGNDYNVAMQSQALNPTVFFINNKGEYVSSIGYYETDYKIVIKTRGNKQYNKLQELINSGWYTMLAPLPR